MKAAVVKKMAEPRREDPSILAEEGLLRLHQIIGDKTRTPIEPPLVPVSKSTWLAWVKAGKAPAKVKLGPRTIAWRVEDIRAWLKQQKAA